MRINDFNATGFDSVIEPSLIAKIENGSNSATLVEKSITENGEYNASSDNADGYSSVTVNVAGGGGEAFEVNITVTDGEQTADKSYAEIVAAINAGKYVVGTIDYAGLITLNIVRATISDIYYGYPGGTQHFTDAVLIYTDVVYEPTVLSRSVMCCGFIGAENGEDFVFVKAVEMAS